MTSDARERMNTYIVEWHYATYSGHETVVTWERDLDDEAVIAKAKKQWRRHFGPPMAMAYESWRIVERCVCS